MSTPPATALSSWARRRGSATGWTTLSPTVDAYRPPDAALSGNCVPCSRPPTCPPGCCRAPRPATAPR